MKRSLVMLALVLMTIAGVAAGWSAARLAGAAAALPSLPTPRYAFASHALKLEQIRPLGELVTLEVPVSDVQTSRLEGITGGAGLVLLVHGSVLVGTDLEQAKLNAIDDQARTAVLTLPMPRITRPRLDQQRTQLYRSDRTGLWQLFPTPGVEAALYDRAMKQAQAMVEHAADQPELIERAQRRTEEVLTPFLTALGWRVTLQWATPHADTAQVGKITP